MKKIVYPFFIFIAFVLGGVLRILALSQFNYYNDSYYMMLVAKNIAEHFSLAGTLGPVGEQVVPLFYKWGYSFFIVPFYTLLGDLEFSAHITSLAFGIAAIGLMYLFTAKLFRSKPAGICACFLLAISFTHTAFSGLVMSETTAFFFNLLALYLFLLAAEKEENIWFVTSGIVFGIAVIVRLESILLVLPVIFWIFTKLKNPFKKFITWFLSGFSFLILTFVVMFWRMGFWWWVENQYARPDRFLKFYSGTFILLISLFIITIILLLVQKKPEYKKALFTILTVVLFLGIIIALGFIYYFGFPQYYLNFSAFINFVKVDFLAGILGIIGLFYLFKKDRNIFIFFLLIFLPLFLIYYPRSDFRFFIHLLLVLIPASAILLIEIYKIIRIKIERVRSPILYISSIFAIIFVFSFLFLLQTSQAAYRKWLPPVSYEKQMSLQLAGVVKEKNISSDVIILTYHIEPCYIDTGLSSWQIKKEKPYIPEEVSLQRPLLVIIDEGMWDQRPEFSQFAEYSLKPYNISEFKIDVPYYHGRYHYWSDRPVKVYLVEDKEILFKLLITNF